MTRYASTTDNSIHSHDQLMPLEYTHKKKTEKPTRKTNKQNKNKRQKPNSTEKSTRKEVPSLGVKYFALEFIVPCANSLMLYTLYLYNVFY